MLPTITPNRHLRPARNITLNTMGSCAFMPRHSNRKQEKYNARTINPHPSSRRFHTPPNDRWRRSSRVKWDCRQPRRLAPWAAAEPEGSPERRRKPGSHLASPGNRIEGPSATHLRNHSRFETVRRLHRHAGDDRSRGWRCLFDVWWNDRGEKRRTHTQSTDRSGLATTHWDPGVYSVVKFELKPQGSGTTLILDHTGFPEGEYDSLFKGWGLRYWDPLKKYLG